MSEEITDMCFDIFEYYGGCEHCYYPICCHQSPTTSNAEIKKLAKCKGIGVSKFKKKYITKLNVPFNNKKIKQPCPFFKNEKCSCYNNRPLLCKLYPFDISHGYVKIEGINLCQTATYMMHDIDAFFKEYIKPHVKSNDKEMEEMKTAIDTSKQIFGKEYQEHRLVGIHSEMAVMPNIIIAVFYLYKIKKIPIEILMNKMGINYE